MKKIIFPLLFAFALNCATAQEKASREDVIKLIEMSDKKLLPTSLKEELFNHILKQSPMDDAHKATFSINLDAYLQKATDDLVDFYTQQYSKEDVKTMLDFYQSPIGLKVQQKADMLLELKRTMYAGLTDVINNSVSKAYGE